MGHTLGFALQGRFNDLVSLALIIVRFASATGCDLPDLPDALLVHPLAPKLHRGSAHAEPLGDGHILLTRHHSKDNPAAQRYLLGRSVCGFPLFQLKALSRLQLDRQTCVRHGSDHTKRWNSVKLFMGHYTRCLGGGLKSNGLAQRSPDFANASSKPAPQTLRTPWVTSSGVLPAVASICSKASAASVEPGSANLALPGVWSRFLLRAHGEHVRALGSWPLESAERNSVAP